MSAGPSTPHDTEAGPAIPTQSLWSLFVRFLRFGALAWGGPVAQIGMLRHALVDTERWISSAEFNRVLALYQVLPGPEAHELCVYFGYRARGRVGGLLAGLGFMLPGFVLMLLLSWAYVTHGTHLQGMAAVFAAVQAVVAALIVRAVVRIGGHVVVDGWLWGIAALAMCAQLAGVHFGIVLALGGAGYVLARAWRGLAIALLVLCGAGIAWQVARSGTLAGFDALSEPLASVGSALQVVSVPALFWSGLKAGLLTFGGAYTAIPFLQRDAVVQGAWMSNAQFLDGLALGGLLPAPLVIFATFVGYLGGGVWGAVAMTAGMFLPAFAFTLLGHDAMARLVQQPRVHRLLEGITAAVVGLIAGTTLALLRSTLTDAQSLVLFALALAVLFATKRTWVIPALILGAALWGWVAGSLA
jgi:chromate transporter